MSVNTSSAHVGRGEPYWATKFRDAWGKAGAETAQLLATSGKAALRAAATTKAEGGAR